MRFGFERGQVGKFNFGVELLDGVAWGVESRRNCNECVAGLNGVRQHVAKIPAREWGAASRRMKGEGVARVGGVTVVRGDGVDRGAHDEIKIASVRMNRFIILTIALRD